ncbi:MAG: T9SS type A sorting domain-containing protein [Saprospiraceae bacterium]|nr:T9SS type A sorting domain-containing protein [Saprospiraceae bacterium]
MKFRLIVVLFLCFGIFIKSDYINAQVSLYKLTENNELITNSKKEHRTSGFRDLEVNCQNKIPINLIRGGSYYECLDTFDIFDIPIDTIYNIGCKPIDNGTFTMQGNCFNYVSNGTVGNDTVCITICNEQNECCNIHFYFFNRAPLPLPFFDDFSYKSAIPDTKLWLDKDVYINQTLAYNPPSIGVATFDGLNSAGLSYNGGYGKSDALTSSYIDLSPYNDQSNVWLNFLVQPKGISYYGPEKKDSLVVEFRKSNGSWQSVYMIEGPTDLYSQQLPDSFFYHRILITDPSYFYEGFQFRISNYSDRAGLSDMWHLDYVRILTDENPTRLVNDMALVNPPTSIFGDYNNIPWTHFVNDPSKWLVSNFETKIYNHFPNTNSLTSSNVKYIVPKNNATLLNRNLVLLATNIESDSILHYQDSFMDTDLNSASASLEENYPNLDSLNLMVKYSIKAGGVEWNSAAVKNDTVSKIFELYNYFAHDDGSAEIGIGASGFETSIAVEFDATVEDTIRAIEISMPRINTDASNQRFKLLVWADELNLSPTYQSKLLSPIYLGNYIDTISNFVTYVLQDANGNPTPVPITSGKFYIGWQQFSNAGFPIPVGFDLNTYDENKTRNYYRTSSATVWDTIDYRGSIMIRPVVGSNTPVNSSQWVSQEEISKDQLFSIFPNPVDQILSIETRKNINTDKVLIQVYNSNGIKIMEKNKLENINTADFVDGVYFIRIYDKERSYFLSKKFIVLHNK